MQNRRKRTKSEKSQAIKKKAINLAHKSGDNFYVLSVENEHGNRKFQKNPVNWNSFIDFTDPRVKIEFVAFPHTSFSKTVPTQETTNRFASEDARYALFKRKQTRKPSLTWDTFNLENAQ